MKGSRWTELPSCQADDYQIGNFPPKKDWPISKARIKKNARKAKLYDQMMKEKAQKKRGK